MQGSRKSVNRRTVPNRPCRSADHPRRSRTRTSLSLSLLSVCINVLYVVQYTVYSMYMIYRTSPFAWAQLCFCETRAGKQTQQVSLVPTCYSLRGAVDFHTRRGVAIILLPFIFFCFTLRFSKRNICMYQV